MIPEFSERLKDYIKRVEDESKTKPLFELMPLSPNYDGPHGQFLSGPQYPIPKIEVETNLPPNHPATERVIAHEFTHLLMMKGWKYPFPDVPDVERGDVARRAANVMNLLDNIVIDVHISNKGFPPTNENILSSMNAKVELLETAFLQGAIPTTSNQDDLLLEEILNVSDYIYWWAIPRFVELDGHIEKLVRRFRNIFQKVFVDEFEKAKQLKKLLKGYDIFKEDGRNEVVDGALILWCLKKHVEYHRMA